VLRGGIHTRDVGRGQFEGNVAIGCPAVSEVTERRECRLSKWIAVRRSSVVEDDAPATGNRAPETCRAVEVRQEWLRHVSMQPQPSHYASSFVTLSHGIWRAGPFFLHCTAGILRVAWRHSTASQLQALDRTSYRAADSSR
jgi:hypothetical protein